MKTGILGAGFIASVLAKAFNRNQDIKLQAVACRTSQKAKAFAEEFGVEEVYESCAELLESKSCDMIYLATPTGVRHDLAQKALETGHHLLIDKPFINSESALSLSQLAKEKGLAFMDATHFTHHPRTERIREEIARTLGIVKSIRSSFCFPSMDLNNIRLNPDKEPTGAIGDMGWYNMRAIVEYMPERGDLVKMSGFVEKHPETGAIVRGSGVASFSSGLTSSFDFGYSVGSTLMDLDILGENAVIQLSDFVLDWRESFAYQNPDCLPYYLLREGVNPLTEARKIECEHLAPQEDLMVREFLKLTKAPQGEEAQSAIDRALQTQKLVDAFASCATVL